MDFVLRRLFLLTLLPSQKGSKVNLSDYDKYRSIAISSLLGKILDHIIIVKQSEALTTSQQQYVFCGKDLIEKLAKKYNNLHNI